MLITTKGEAIAIGIAMMTSFDLANCDHGPVAKVKRNIMERDVYPRKWGMGPVAMEKKTLKGQGKLDKYGRPNENTPAKWNEQYKDYSQPEVDLPTALKQQSGEKTAKKDVLEAPPKDPAADPMELDQKVNGDAKKEEDEEKAVVKPAVNGDASSSDEQPKKKQKKEKTEEERKAEKKQKHKEKKANETPEERADRKRKRKEKKEAKAGKQEGSSSD